MTKTPEPDDGWQHVVLSDHAHQAIRAQARGNFKNTGVRRPDGTWLVPFTRDTIAAVSKRALPGESLSDTIERVLATMPKDGSTRRGYQ